MELSSRSAVLLLNLPQSAFAGIDLLSFTTTPRFHGVRNLPEGLHFVFTGLSTAFSERHGIWFDVRRDRTNPGALLLIAKWDTASETLVPETSEAEILRWRANMGAIWREGLTPYRQSTSSELPSEASDEFVDWPMLTSNITTSLLSRITGADSQHWTLSSASSAKRDLEDIPGLNPNDIDLQADKVLNFLPVNLKQTWREGAMGRERTDAAQDRSWALKNIIEECCTDSDALEIVGELQFCFLMVLTINNFSCLEQWKRILTLLLTCKSAVVTRADLFVQAIQSLMLQLQHCKLADSGLIDLADEGGTLLKSLLVRFRKGLQSLSGLGVQAVVDELDELEDYLRQEHGWQFGGAFAKSGVLDLEDGEQVRMDTTAFDEDDETGEYAPQIVELTSEQARMLNVGSAEDLHLSLSKTSLHEVQLSEEDEEGEDVAPNGTHQSPAGEDETTAEGSEDEEEEVNDLEDMDARY